MKLFFITILMLNVITLLCALITENMTDFRSAEQNKNGYHFKYDTSNGIHRAETCQIKQKEGELSLLHILGRYSYISPDGIETKANYTAGVEGYKTKVIYNSKRLTPISIFLTDSPPTLSTIPTTEPPSIDYEPVIDIIGSAAIGTLTGGGLG